MNLTIQLTTLQNKFIDDVKAAIVDGLREAILGTPQSLALPPLNDVIDRAGSRKRAAKGGKRDPKVLAKLVADLGAHIKKHPGQRIEVIGKAMGVPTKALTLPVQKLLKAKAISTKGQRRAMAYFPAKGAK